MVVNFILIGQRIKESRTEKHMSQAELAEQINMSAPYISHIETAIKHVSLTTLVHIANALGITVDSLLAGNQLYDTTALRSELLHLIDDCNIYEKQIIYDIASSLKKSLRNNRFLRRKI